MTEVDLTGSHPCPVPGCRGSAEEHHRVNVGLVMENAELRRRLRENEVVDPLAERKAVLLQQIEDFLNPRADAPGGLSAVAASETKPPDLVTPHEETTR